jgi:magnesium transporter
MTSSPNEPRVEPQIDNPADASPEDERVAELLEHTLDVPVLASAVGAQDAADAADTLETLAGADAAVVLEEMDLEAAAHALAHMLAPLASSVLSDLAMENPSYAARLIEQMPLDDAADLLQDSSEAVRQEILAATSPTTREVLATLLMYDEESAGGLMSPEVLTVRSSMTVTEAVEELRRSELDEDSQYVFVVDEDRRLAGIVGLRALIIAAPDDLIEAICEREVDAIPPDLDQEAVAHEFEKYDYLMLPVIDEKQRLLGVITVDDVIDSIRAEGTEDAQLMVGAGREEMVFSPTSEKLKGRFPWLVVNLLTSAVAAGVVLQFEDLIAEVAVLAVLMPVIANQSGNAGQQSLAVTLRGIVLDQVRPALAWRLIAREGMVGLINGAIAGVLVGVAVGMLGLLTADPSWRLGLVIAVSMTFSLMIGTLAGAGLPLLMKRFGFDPATASTIFLTMVTDSTSFLVFLGLAGTLSGWIGA